MSTNHACIKFWTGVLPTVSYILWFIVPTTIVATLITIWEWDKTFYVYLISCGWLSILTFRAGFIAANYDGTLWGKNQTIWTFKPYLWTSFWSFSHIIYSSPLWYLCNFFGMFSEKPVGWLIAMNVVTAPLMLVLGYGVGIAWYRAFKINENEEKPLMV